MKLLFEQMGSAYTAGWILLSSRLRNTRRKNKTYRHMGTTAQTLLERV